LRAIRGSATPCARRLKTDNAIGYLYQLGHRPERQAPAVEVQAGDNDPSSAGNQSSADFGQIAREELPLIDGDHLGRSRQIRNPRSICDSHRRETMPIMRCDVTMPETVIGAVFESRDRPAVLAGVLKLCDQEIALAAEHAAGDNGEAATLTLFFFVGHPCHPREMWVCATATPAARHT